jgi:hypothetical protein
VPLPAVSRQARSGVAGTLPGSVGVERERAENGDIYIWLDPGVVAMLKAPRGSGAVRPPAGRRVRSPYPTFAS